MWDLHLFYDDDDDDDDDDDVSNVYGFALSSFIPSFVMDRCALQWSTHTKPW